MASRKMTTSFPMTTSGQGSTPTTTVPSDTGGSITEPDDELPGGFTLGGAYQGGINKDYKLPTADQFGDPQNPYYYKNDDWQMILRRTTNDVAIIQSKLIKAFPDYKPGRVGDKLDNNTIYYLKKAMARINMMNQDSTNPVRGKTLDDALTYLSNNPAPGDKTKSSLPSYRLTSTEDLKAVFTRAAQDTIGRTLSDRELQRLADAYNQQEMAYQKKAAYGGTAMQAPQPTTFAEGQIEQKFATEAKANDYTNYVSILSQMMAGE
jgi:hypothetical protein